MPIYEYQCEDCDLTFELMILSNIRSLPFCPNCKGRKVKKLISSSFIRPEGIPKGSGGFHDNSCASSIKP